MRTDVKLGVVISMVVVFIAGGYFIFRGGAEKPINLAENTPNSNPGDAGRQTVPGLTENNANRRNTGTPGTPNRNNRQAQNRPLNAQPAQNAAADSPASVEFAGNTQDTSAPGVSPATTNLTLTPNTQPADNPARSPAITDRVARTDGPVSPLTNAPATQPPSSAMEALAAMRKAAPAEAKPNANTGTAAVDIHRAQPGDTLASLSQTYYGSAKYVPVLRQANPDVTDPSSLRVGAAIRIPPLPADAASLVDGTSKNTPPQSTPVTANDVGRSTAPGNRTYVVKPGDSFYRIAEQQLGKASRWKELLALNKTLVDGDPTRLRVGQKVVLPES